MKPKICHVVASINEHTGGTASTIIGLVDALTQQQIENNIFTWDYPELGRQILPSTVPVQSHAITAWGRYLRGFQPKTQQALAQFSAHHCNLIHNHGMWMFSNLYARQASVINSLPLIISPEGMLEPWSLKRSFLKKRLAWLLYESKNLRSAHLFHATSRQEVQAIRNIGFQQPIALIPYGVELPNLTHKPSRQPLVETYPELAQKKWLLFLSRIHPKKGLENLIKIWQKLAHKFLDWHLIIAGPDWTNYHLQLQSLITNLGLENQVTMTGMLTGKQKESALANADLFVLPSYSENFGYVIAESLAYGVPVLTTKATPWQDLLTSECGWWIENHPDTLENTLTEAMTLSETERQAMGLNGRKLIETQYSWNAVSEQMANVYRWVLTGGQPPNCIQFQMKN